MASNTKSLLLNNASRLNCTIHVRGLDQSVTVEALEAAFIPFGDIAEIVLPEAEPQTKNDVHRGFAYIEFESHEDAVEAIDNMNQSELYGKVIKVEIARPFREQYEGINSSQAIWRQEGWIAKNELTSDKNLDMNSDDDPFTLANIQKLTDLEVAGPKDT